MGRMMIHMTISMMSRQQFSLLSLFMVSNETLNLITYCNTGSKLDDPQCSQMVATVAVENNSKQTS